MTSLSDEVVVDTDAALVLPDAEVEPSPRFRRSALWRPASVLAVGVLISWIYGVFGGGSVAPLSGFSFVAGWADCLGDGLVPCTRLGYPEGVRPTLGIPLYGGMFVLAEVAGLHPMTALQTIAGISIIVGSAALWHIVRRLGGSDLAALGAPIVYYLLPTIHSHTGLPVLFFALILLPVPVAVAVELVTRDLDRRASALLVGGLLLSGAVVIGLNPYAYVLTGVLIGPLLVVAAWQGRRSPVALLGRLGGLLAFGALTLLYRVLATSTTESTSPAELYRAMGADLFVVFRPTGGTPLGDLLPFADRPWTSTEFYGDGTQLQVYLGVVLAGSLVGGLVVIYRRGLRVLAAGFALSALAFFLLGLGPSIKFGDRAPVPTDADGALTYSDYLMPAEDATLSAPWAPIYSIQPVASFRATYRWHVGLALVLAVAVPLVVEQAARRRRALGLAIAVLVLLELPLSRVGDLREAAGRNGDQIEQFESDIDATFGAGALSPSDRVLFLPAANDYLLGWAAPHLQVYSYNISFDKELARIRPLQPTPVQEAVARYRNEELTGDDVCGLFRDRLVEAVVFTDFSARWDSYWWPPSESNRISWRERADAVGIDRIDGLVVDDRGLAQIVRADDGCRPTP